LLEGAGKEVRHVRIKNLADIGQAVLQTLLQEAMLLNETEKNRKGLARAISVGSLLESIVMKFGRLEASALSQVAWDLPEDSPATQALLGKLPPRTQVPAVHIGCSVWTDRSFVGKVYPQGTPARDFLKIYCQQFNTVELNTTFYSIPSVEKVKKWKEAATPGFQFCPKIPQSISHSNNMDKQRHLLDIFLEAVLHFEQALGMTFMQLPPYFKPISMQALQKLLTHIPKEFPLAVELRHPLWFSDEVAQQELFSFLQAHGIVAVITDVAGRRDVLHQTLTTREVFIRFTGNNLHATDYMRIDAWVARLHLWLEQGLSSIYFLLHEPEKALCADLAVYMIRQLNKLEGVQLSPPSLGGKQTVLAYE